MNFSLILKKLTGEISPSNLFTVFKNTSSSKSQWLQMWMLNSYERTILSNLKISDGRSSMANLFCRKIKIKFDETLSLRLFCKTKFKMKSRKESWRMLKSRV